MQSLIVETIIWQGRQGGAIFTAGATDGKRYRVVAGAKIMPRPPVIGEVWHISGRLQRHPSHGQQVVAESAILQKPSGRLIVKTITGSRAFPGIGDVRARALWDYFGESIYPLLTAGEPGPFAPILGAELAVILVEGWASLELEASLYQWLDSHGLPVWIARKLLGIYGADVIAKMGDNPYRLLAFTSWQHADQLGRSMGLAENDRRRFVAAADAVCYQRLTFSHTWASKEVFCSGLQRLLGGDKNLALQVANFAQESFAVIDVNGGLQGAGPFSMERFIASRSKAMLSGDFEAEQMSIRMEPSAADLEAIYADFLARTGLNLNAAQREAVRLAVTSPLSCITGGAGVGKTTVLRAIHLAAEDLGFGGVIQMALSGRAAKRMADATGRRSYTIAGFLLGVDAGKIKLENDCLLVIDESSMLDLPHCYRIMRRMPPGTRLLLVGDTAQLPPIGFGLTFHALAGHALIPTVELTEIHRQAAATGIPQASVAIRYGTVPELGPYSGLMDGVSFIDAGAGEISDRLLEVVNDLGGVGACQLVGAVKNGLAGVRTINHLFHDLVATGRAERHGYAEGEPVIWTVNDPQRGLFNGSLGTVVEAQDALVVEFDGIRHELEDGDERDMEHAYAITVHKSQGSQFERVVVPVFPSRLLDRTLLYTAITRAERQVVLIGDRKSFEQAVQAPPAPSRRETGILFHLSDNITKTTSHQQDCVE